MTAESLENLRLRRVGLVLLAARGNPDAITRLAALDARIKLLADTEEPLFRKTP